MFLPQSLMLKSLPINLVYCSDFSKKVTTSTWPYYVSNFKVIKTSDLQKKAVVSSANYIGKSYLAEQFCQIKRSVAELFRQIKRSVAEHLENKIETRS